MKTIRNGNYKKPNLTSAIDASGEWKHINEVESGLACNCYCPHCKAKLIAINSKPESESKAHHFAHVKGSDCVWSDESSLHILAKQVLAEEQKIMLPALQGESVARQLEFDSVEPEMRDPKTGLIPDCVCYYGGQKLWVEFKRTHEVDTRKAEKIRNAKIDCIEIDINVCEINKEAVRKFIVEESNNRIWVYNSKTQQTKTWKERGERNQSEYTEHEYILIDRHYAYDENACLVNLNKINSDYDLDAHRYFCVSCGQELKHVDGRFVHIEENKKCVDEIYLHKAAKEVIYNTFYNSKVYNVAVPKYHICQNIDTCIFADKNRCFSEGRESFNLKSVGYKMCEKGVKVPGHHEVYDIVIRKPKSLEDAIVVNLSTEDCERDLETSFRQVEIHITNEYEVMRLEDALNIGAYRNFSDKSEISAKPEEIQSPVLKFSLYRSGKAFIGPVSCTAYGFPRNREVIQEFVYQGEIESLESIRQFSLLSCYEKGHIGCYCEICAYIRRNSGYRPICIIYKAKGTPRNPLDSKPCQCNAFSLDRKLADKLRNQCKNITLIEPNLKV